MTSDANHHAPPAGHLGTDQTRNLAGPGEDVAPSGEFSPPSIAITPNKNQENGQTLFPHERAERPDADQRIALMDGEAALPRKNGELVFEAPWEGRAFGLAVALCDSRAYPWGDFRDRLIAQIVHDEAEGQPTTYYERWLAALESLLLDRGLVTEAEIAARAEQLSVADEHG